MRTVSPGPKLRFVSRRSAGFQPAKGPRLWRGIAPAKPAPSGRLEGGATPNAEFSPRIIQVTPGGMANPGFTLLEIIVAVAILGVGIGMAMQIFSSGLNNVRRIEMAHRAMGHAENVMNELLTDASVTGPAQFSGDLDSEFAYTATVDYWQPPEEGLELEVEQRPVELLSVTVEIHFKNDRFGKKYRTATLKSVSTNPEQVGPVDPAEAIRQLFGNRP